jgi:hypothetical protein
MRLRPRPRIRRGPQFIQHQGEPARVCRAWERPGSAGSDGDPDTVEVDIDISGEFEANGMRVPLTASDLDFLTYEGSQMLPPHPHPDHVDVPLDIPVDVYACPSRFPHFSRPICAPTRGAQSVAGVAGGGDTEQLEDLLVERVELGLEGLDELAVAV